MVRADTLSRFSKCGIIDFVSQASQNTVQSLLYLKHINKIACFHYNGFVTLYEADTHAPVKSFKAHCGPIANSYYHAKANKLITQYGGEIKIWDLSQTRYTEVATVNVSFTVVNSIELLKKQNTLVVSGEMKRLRRPEKFETLYQLDLGKNEIVGEWKDYALVQTTQKIRYAKNKYLIGCGFTNGYIKLFSCNQKGFHCLLTVKAHSDKVTKLHVTRINNHPYCISESDDGRIRLWNVTSKLLNLRNFFFKQKKMIGGSFYKHRVLVLFEERGTEVLFLNLLSGVVVKRIDIGVRSISKGITLGNKEKVMLVLDIPKAVYLGIRDC